MADAKISALPSVAAPTSSDPIPLVEAGVTSRSTILAIINSGMGGVPAAGQLPVGNAGSTAYAPVPLSGDATLASTGALSLASIISAAGPIGSATVAPIITYDAKGRLTAVSSATITPAVGNITGLGANVAAWLATPSSANLIAALTDETGTGAAVFANTPTLVSPVLGTPTSGTLTNCTGLPIAGLVASTSTAIGVGSIELGNASDTTISRSSAGVIAVEGVVVDTISAANELTNKTLNASVGKGTWTASGTWTLPAHTINGAITYGGVTLSNAVTGTGNMVLSASPTLTGTAALAAQTNSGTITQTSASATAFESGPNGGTNPVLRIVNSTASQADGVSITGGAAGSGTTFTALSSGSNSGFTFTPKGTGSFTASKATGNIFNNLTTGDNSRAQFIATNTTDSAYFGIESTAGGTFTGTAAGSALFGSNGAHSAHIVTNSNVRLTIDSAGLISLPAIGSDATHTDATVCVDTTTKALYSGSGTLGICLGTSSERFKHGIEELKDGLNRVLSLIPVSYIYNSSKEERRLYGFTAERTAKTLPEVVSSDADGNPNSVDMLGIIPFMINAIKELWAQNQALNARLAAVTFAG